jgi:hypothetical protein
VLTDADVSRRAVGLLDTRWPVRAVSRDAGGRVLDVVSRRAGWLAETRAPVRAVSREVGRVAAVVSRRVGWLVETRDPVRAVSREVGRVADAESRRAVWPEVTRVLVPARAVSRRELSAAARGAAFTHTISPRSGRGATSPLACTLNGPAPPLRA